MRHKYDNQLILKLSSEFKTHTNIAKEYARLKGIDYTDSIRRTVSYVFKENKNVSNLSETIPNDYFSEDKLTARPEGVTLNIEQYCKYYNLPYEHVSSYKFISHSGEPFYNIVFKPVVLSSDFNFSEILDDLISRYPKITDKIKPEKYDKFDRLIYTDSHIGMCTGGKDALYPTLWNKETQQRDFNILADEAIREKTSDVIYLDDLGDHMDGFNGKTTRGGHELPQNMNNKEAFTQGIECKLILANKLSKHFKKVVFNNVCNDNHAGDFGYMVNETFKRVAELKYNNVKVFNHESFISHYAVKNRCFILSHGKDKEKLKFGFKVHIDEKQINKIDSYCKEHKLYRKYDFIEFSKGDSHQCLFDMASTDDFDYFNYPALSPSSEWVQTNFKRGRRGFVIQSICTSTNKVKSLPVWL